MITRETAMTEEQLRDHNSRAADAQDERNSRDANGCARERVSAPPPSRSPYLDTQRATPPEAIAQCTAIIGRWGMAALLRAAEQAITAWQPANHQQLPETQDALALARAKREAEAKAAAAPPTSGEVPKPKKLETVPADGARGASPAAYGEILPGVPVRIGSSSSGKRRRGA